AHSMFDPELYRDKAEVERWQARDPIALASARLRQGGQLDDDGLRALEAEVAAEVDAAVAFAEAGTWEPIERLADDVYTPQVAS
ncbi:MAG TPA: thiamine pyrophosphate-dependent enzyme, partial [Polyangia bacterium]